MAFSCEHAGTCGGCPSWATPYDEQLAHKRRTLADALAEAGLDASFARGAVITSLGEAGLRDRVDLAFVREPDGTPRLGLRDLGRAYVVDLEACPQLSPRLAPWHAEVRRHLPPVVRASLRLRVAPDGRRGLWVDVAHVDAKALLDEPTWLRAMGERAAVELGQRRKPVLLDPAPARPRLGKEPALGPWFLTWLGDDARPTPLFGPVGGFSQPGLAPARAIVAAVRAAVRDAGASEVLEIGCGNGQLTLPIAADGRRVVAVDTDAVALAGLARGVEAAGVGAEVEVRAGSLAGSGLAQLAMRVDTLVVDPPRSGLGAFVGALAGLPAASRPRHVVYVSCHPEALVRDAAGLEPAGYGLEDIEGIDQFPQTPHIEWVARFRRRG